MARKEALPFLPPLQIVHWEVGVDLRDIRWNKREVERIVRRYRLRHGQAVIFFNNAKEFGGNGTQPPKCRLYWVWHGQAVSIIPPVDEGARQVSYQLRLSEWMRNAFGCSTRLTEVLTGFEDALGRRQAAIEAARKRRKKG
jgi:hypothetical protein